MATGPIRVNLFFEMADTGWSETWFRVGDDPIASAEAPAIELARARLKMMVTDAKCIAVRVSDENVTGDSLVTYLTAGANVGDLAGPADAPFNGVYTRIEAGSLYRRGDCLRGVPVSIMTAPFGTAARWADFLAAFNSWAALLTDLNGRWRLRVASKENTNPKRYITAMVDDPAGEQLWKLTVNGHDFVPGEKVQLTGFPRKLYGGKKINGRYTVTQVVGQDFKVLAPFVLPNPYKQNGFARAVRTTYIRPTSLIPERFSSRKVGRIFGEPRGRRARATV